VVGALPVLNLLIPLVFLLILLDDHDHRPIVDPDHLLDGQQSFHLAECDK
jgi:hypothetical protein